MTKPVITTRASKGAALTWTEGDTNLTNLRDATITVSDGTNSTAIDLNGTITFSDGLGLVVAENTGTVSIAMTDSGLPTPTTGTVSATDGTTEYITLSTTTSMMTGWQITFSGANLSGTGITADSPYYLVYIDGGNNQVQISTTIGGSPLDINTVGSITGVTFSASSGSGGSYKLSYNAGSETVSWVNDSSASVSLSTLSDVSLSPPVTDGYVLTYNSTAGNWQAQAAAAGGISNVVEDTTPQLGGNLDMNGNYLTDSSGSGYGPNLYSASQNDPIRIQSRFIELGTPAQTSATDIYTKGASTMRFGPGEMSYSNLQIIAGANGNITLNPDGTGKAVIKQLNYNEGPIYSVTYGATITPDVSNGNVQTVTLTGNVTFSAFTSPVAGQSLTLIVKQDATGGRTLTSTMLFAGGEKTLSIAANAIDIISVYYDGTNYYASLAKGFA